MLYCILNLITSILKNYEVETKYNSLEKIDKLLEKRYKNVVLVILDGMGENILANISTNGIFAKNKIDEITSVYPSTTTAAMTTYYSGAKKAKMTMMANTVEEMCESIVTLCKNTEDKFIMAYNDNPDGIIHKNGCYSEETKKFILKAEQEFEKMLQELKNTNTLVILSADHGHQDINETIDILELDEIQECLIIPPTLESRMIGFFVKNNKRKEFENKFNKMFKDKYILYSKEDLLKSNLLGNGNKHKKVEDFIGDYVAIAVSDTRIKIGTYLSREIKNSDEKKSTHCGLTKNEMEVPLIVFDLKDKD